MKYLLILIAFLSCSKTTFVANTPYQPQPLPNGVTITYYIATTESGWLIQTSNRPRAYYYIDTVWIQSWCKGDDVSYFRLTEGVEAAVGSVLKIDIGHDGDMDYIGVLNYE